MLDEKDMTVAPGESVALRDEKGGMRDDFIDRGTIFEGLREKSDS